MSTKYNDWYIKAMHDAAEDTVLGRLRKLWWPPYLEAVKGPANLEAIDRLDSFMNEARDEFLKMADDYGKMKAPLDKNKQRQRTSQFLKSNTGKMFERFVGLSLAHLLNQFGGKFSLLPFRNDAFEMLTEAYGISRSMFEINVTNCGGSSSAIDADLVLFNTEDATSFFVMISIKSTLKDRFHNVPFWNLLRHCALSEEMKHISPKHTEFLRSVHYIAICTDLAEEQPDFASEDGPRNLLTLDASLLDGAYVTCSKAKGLNSQKNCFGIDREDAFCFLSDFIRHLHA